MEEHWIYVRTLAGEAAMRKRRQLAHRDLRTVLARVDGHSSVGELIAHVGDSQLVVTALAELERLLLIERRWMPTEPEGRAKTDAGAAVAAKIRVPPGRQRDLPGWRATARARLSSWQRRRKARREEKAFLRAYEVHTDEDSFAPVKLKPIRRGRERQVRWLARIVAGLGLAAALLVVVLLLFPYSYYRAEIEQQVGSTLGEAVAIGDVRFGFLPFPHLALVDVSIGAGCEVGTVRLIPDLLSLRDERWVIDYAQFEDVRLRRQGIVASSRWFAEAGGAAGAPLLRRVGFERVGIDVGGARLDDLSGVVHTDAAGRWTKIVLQDAAHGLKVDARPNPTGYSLAIVGTAARLSLTPDLSFEYVEAQGEIDGDSMRLPRIDARFYGGIVEASGVLDWSRDLRLSADAVLKRTSLSRVASAVNASLSLEGELSGKLHFESHAKDWESLRESLRVDGDFVAERGVINRFDLMEALRANRLTRGGQTRYHRLSGVVRKDDLAVSIGQLKIDAGMLQATGAVDIDWKGDIRGSLDVDLKGPAARFRAAVALAGSVADPQLLTRHSERGERSERSGRRG